MELQVVTQTFNEISTGQEINLAFVLQYNDVWLKMKNRVDDGRN